MIRIHGPKAHGSPMKDGLVGQGAKGRMPVYDLDTFADEDVAEDGKQGEDGGEGGVPVDNGEGNVVDLEAVGEVADAVAVAVGVGDYDDFVAAVDEFCGELVDVGFDSPWLRVEEVADHGDVVGAARHLGGWGRFMGGAVFVEELSSTEAPPVTFSAV